MAPKDKIQIFGEDIADVHTISRVLSRYRKTPVSPSGTVECILNAMLQAKNDIGEDKLAKRLIGSIGKISS